MNNKETVSFDTFVPNATILIPTYNRPKELKRLLSFLSYLNNPYPIVILDASTPENQKLNRDTMRPFNQVIYRNFHPNTHIGVRINLGLSEYVSTEYVLFCGDDDFVTPSGIFRCSKFLDENQGFSASNGFTLCLAYPKRFSNSGFFSFINDLKNPLILDQPTFLSRMLKHDAICNLGCPPLFYAVRRTQHARQIFNKIHDSLKYSSQEVLSNALTLLWGKSVTIPYLLNLRDFSSETTRDELREDAVHYITAEDALYIRELLKQEIKKTSEAYSDKVIDFMLDQFIALPLAKFSNSYTQMDMRTSFAKKIAEKRHWPFYFIHYFFPSFYEKFYTTIDKKTMVALKKAFQAA